MKNKNGKGHWWSEDEIKFLKENYRLYDDSILAKKMNLTEGQIRHQRRKLDLVKPDLRWYSKNEGVAKGALSTIPNILVKYQFKKGHRPKHYMPIGTIRINKINNCNEIKVSETYPRWIPYSHLILKKNGIEIPKGCVVLHIDGNSLNDELDNLEIVTNREILRINRIGLTNDKEVNKLIIASVRHKYKLIDAMKERNE